MPSDTILLPGWKPEQFEGCETLKDFKKRITENKYWMEAGFDDNDRQALAVEAYTQLKDKAAIEAAFQKKLEQVLRLANRYSIEDITTAVEMLVAGKGLHIPGLQGK